MNCIEKAINILFKKLNKKSLETKNESKEEKIPLSDSKSNTSIIDTIDELSKEKTIDEYGNEYTYITKLVTYIDNNDNQFYLGIYPKTLIDTNKVKKMEL